MKKRIKTKGWSEESRRKQAERIRTRKPWNNSTGPKTPEGKAVCAQNALKSGLHTAEMRELKALLHTQAQLIKALSPTVIPSAAEGSDPLSTFRSG